MSSTISKNLGNKPKVTVLILNYNGDKTLVNSIQSVLKSNYSNLEIIIVDNNSSDNSLQIAQKKFSQNEKINFIKNEKNLGFGAGNNVGIKFAFQNDADYVFLLNNDAFIEENTILNLIEVVNNIDLKKKIGLVSPVIYNEKRNIKFKSGDVKPIVGGYEDNESRDVINHVSIDEENIWFCGGKINWWKMRAEHLNCGDILSKRLKGNWETEYITGCAMLISKKVYEKIGLFDEQFFLYYEDADLSFRAEQAGFKNIIIQDSKVFHQEQSEDDKPAKIYWLVLSGLIFFKKHSTGWRKIYIQLYLFFRKLKNYLKVKMVPNKLNLSVQKAYRDGKKY